MAPEYQVRVELGERSYDILIGQSLLSNAGAHLKSVIGERPILVVTDTQVAPFHLQPLLQSLERANYKAQSIVIESGEASKSFASLSKLCEQLLGLGLERKSVLIALGGGVIGDLVGFAASILLRGIDFVQIPTTLLAQVDSSVGGKTGINSLHGKNLIGSFHQPRLVIADLSLLHTLPQRHIRAGYAEIVKYGLIDNPDFFAWCEENGAKLIAGDEKVRGHAIAYSCQAKARIVGKDERESNQRALLNLGHTFGHALEAECGYKDTLLHGEAVAIGMRMAFDLSARLGLASEKDSDRLRAHLTAVGLPVSPLDIAMREWPSDRLIDHMKKDKKIRDGRIAFVLARGIGQAFTPAYADLADVKAVIERTLAKN